MSTEVVPVASGAGETASPVETISVLEAFRRIRDGRMAEGVVYPLESILGLVMAAMISGRGSLRASWLWAEANWDTIYAALGFRKREFMPSYGTVWYALSLCDEGQIAHAMQAWTESVVGHPILLAADGKTLRGSQRRKVDLPGKQVMSIAVPELSAVLTQRTVDNGDAIGALLELLHEVRLDGRLLTVDAGLISREVIDAVSDRGGQVLAPVKGNYAVIEAELNTYIVEQRPEAAAAIARGVLSAEATRLARAATEARATLKQAKPGAAKTKAKAAVAAAEAAAEDAAAAVWEAVNEAADGDDSPPRS